LRRSVLPDQLSKRVSDFLFLCFLWLTLCCLLCALCVLCG